MITNGASWLAKGEETLKVDMTQPPQTTAPNLSIDFATHPDQYKHWKLTFHGRVAKLALDTKERETLVQGYELKRNSYDLGVDIELNDAIQRLRFEHPMVATVVITSAKPAVFSAGANIKMLALATHADKVNFCKFTNETRNCMEDATKYSRQTYICAINGPAAGGGYELALACEHIMLIDDGSTTVSMPELPLLAVLPGTGGVTRLMDKRKVRHDHADVFCTTSEGFRGRRAVEWRFVDELVPRSRFEDTVLERAHEFSERSDRPEDDEGIVLTPLVRKLEADRLTYEHLIVDIDRGSMTARFMVHGPQQEPPKDHPAIQAAGSSFWPLAFARELEDAILHLRANECDIGTWVFRSAGDNDLVGAVDRVLVDNVDHWLVREIVLYLKRTFKRLEVSSRSLIALIEPGSCFTGTLLELVLAADRSYMLDGTFDYDDVRSPTIRLTPMNFSPLPMVNSLTRLERRYLADPGQTERMKGAIGQELEAADALELGLVTSIPDDIDWEDEVRLATEERASFSPDALTGMEASTRFAGPETMESKIFGRLSAWQNWIFQRPNATGEGGALTVYGTGKKGTFDKNRV